MFNPTKRITAEEALAHPYLAQFHVLEEEIVCLKAIEIPINDNEKGTVDDYRDKLYQNIVKVNVEKKEKKSCKKKNLPRKKIVKRNPLPLQDPKNPLPLPHHRLHPLPPQQDPHLSPQDPLLPLPLEKPSINPL
jgi:mitogen-activated protein kinase 15